MPQIQEYLPQTTAQEPVGGTSPNIELAGAVGRSIEHVGGAIEQVGNELHQRAVNEENANTYQNFAVLKEDFLQRIQQQQLDGSLDTEQLKQQYEDESDKIGQNISTPNGRNYFLRQQARAKGALLTKAMFASAQLANNRAQGQFKDATDRGANIIETDPSQHENEYNTAIETMDNIGQDIPEKQRDQIMRQVGVKFAAAQIRGFANMAPADPTEAEPYYDKLKNSLMGSKDQVTGEVQAGAWDQWLNPDQKKAMLNEINQTQKGKIIENNRVQKALDDAKQASIAKWENDNTAALLEHRLSPQAVIQAQKQGQIDSDTAIRWTGMIDRAVKADQRVPTFKGDPQMASQLMKRIVDDNDPNHITMDNFTKEVSPLLGNKLTTGQYNTLMSAVAKSPQAKAMLAGDKAMLQLANTVRFNNTVTGKPDPVGVAKSNQMMQDYLAAKQQMIQQGQDPSVLSNPNSPQYFGNNVGKYITPLREQMQSISQDRADKALGLKPTGNNQTPKPDSGARKPGESAADFLKRKGL